jgi:hypothetical protein
MKMKFMKDFKDKLKSMMGKKVTVICRNMPRRCRPLPVVAGMGVPSSKI